MINLFNTLLPNDRVQAILADIGKTTKPIPVIDRLIAVDVAPMVKLSLLILIFCLRFYNFYISFLIYCFYL